MPAQKHLQVLSGKGFQIHNYAVIASISDNRTGVFLGLVVPLV